MISVVIADDHGVVREGIRHVLEGEADIKICGEASDGRELLEQVEKNQPDVVILDITMPRLSGLETLERIAEAGDETASRSDTEQLRHLFEILLGHPKLTIAAVHGAAVAGGCGLATACDLVVAEPGARFAYTEVKIGFLAALVLTFLTRRVAGHVARRMLLDPEMIGGAKAVEIGLADELTTEGEASSTAVALALKLCAKASPSALAATKALLNETVGLGWREALAAAAAANVRQRTNPECVRGVRSFLETKGTPDWLEDGDGSE